MLSEIYLNSTYYESICKNRGFKSIAGIDEAGRGPLAGPVVVASCILGDDFNFSGITDSKKITEKKREKLFDIIQENCLAYAIEFVAPYDIEKYNISNAIRGTIDKLYERMGVRSDFLLIDSFKVPDNFAKCQSFSFPKADLLSVSVAAASILAKVARDKYMVEMDKIFPGYGFAKHKGYGTKIHYELIDKLGISSIHRPLFLRSWLNKQSAFSPCEIEEQMSKVREEKNSYYYDANVSKVLPELRIFK